MLKLIQILIIAILIIFSPNLKKKFKVEEIYKKQKPQDHILFRPDTYIGSLDHLKQDAWTWDFENERMVRKETKYSPGLYKIFDEILGI
jgi:DNA topoisomerase-2